MSQLKEAEIRKIEIAPPLRSNEATEMLERKPGWLMRWGLLSILFVFGLLFGVAVFVRYPDTLEGEMTITTDPLPVVLKPQVSGRIIQLVTADGAQMQPGSIVAEIESNTSHHSILLLEQAIDSLNRSLEDNETDGLERFAAGNLQSLGEGQPIYNQLLETAAAILFQKKQNIYAQRVSTLQGQSQNVQQITQFSHKELALIEEELRQADERFAANEKLYKDKVISQQEYYEEAGKLRQKKLALEQQKKGNIQNKMSLYENSRQINDIRYEAADKMANLELQLASQIRAAKNFIQEWKQKYLLIAPYEGVLHYLRPMQKNELVNAGDQLFEVTPAVAQYAAFLQLPESGTGRLKPGQTVQLMPDRFPYNEYGHLEGKVKSISAVPEKSKEGTQEQTIYRVWVALPPQLVTSMQHQLPFTPGMSGQGRVITADRSLLQRLIAGIAGWKK